VQLRGCAITYIALNNIKAQQESKNKFCYADVLQQQYIIPTISSTQCT
jgi:hypothetical protein